MSDLATQRFVFLTRAAARRNFHSFSTAGCGATRATASGTRAREPLAQWSGSTGASARNAAARWESWFFSSIGSSAMVLALDAGRETAGRSRNRASPRGALEDLALARAGAHELDAARWIDVRGDAAEAGAASVHGDVAQRIQQLGVVARVVARLAGVARGVDAGRAAERVDLQTRVVGDRGQPGRRAPPGAPSASALPSKSSPSSSSSRGGRDLVDGHQLERRCSRRAARTISRSLPRLRVATTTRTPPSLPALAHGSRARRAPRCCAPNSVFMAPVASATSWP